MFFLNTGKALEIWPLFQGNLIIWMIDICMTPKWTNKDKTAKEKCTKFTKWIFDGHHCFGSKIQILPKRLYLNLLKFNVPVKIFADSYSDRWVQLNDMPIDCIKPQGLMQQEAQILEAQIFTESGMRVFTNIFNVYSDSDLFLVKNLAKSMNTTLTTSFIENLKRTLVSSWYFTIKSFLSCNQQHKLIIWREFCTKYGKNLITYIIYFA